MEIKYVMALKGEIQGKVQEQLDEGWKLYGEPKFMPMSQVLLQAMTLGDYRSKGSKGEK